MSTLLKNYKTHLFLFLMIGFGAAAQETVSETELESFAKSVFALQDLNVNTQNEMMKVVEDSSIDPDRFDELYNAVVTEDTAFLEALHEEESQEFEKIMDRFEALDEVYGIQANALILNQALSLERFDEIAEQIQTDGDLQERFQKYIPQE